MSVLETDLIDYIYLDDEDETPVLVVTDPLTWQYGRRTAPERPRDDLNAQIAAHRDRTD